MFSLFKKKSLVCPVNEDTRELIEVGFALLKQEFGIALINNKKILLPDFEHFPIVYNGEQQTAIDSLKIVAAQMDVDINDISLDFYSEGIREFGTGGVNGGKIYIEPDDDSRLSSGLYYGKNDDDKFHISIEEKNLKDPVGMVSTLAHEIAHIKLLGEDRMDFNNEQLTDLTTVIFGLGIFNANTAFRFSSGFDSWGYRKLGYLSQVEWGYALAVYAYLREEENPPWAKHLSETVRGNFKRGMQFILANKQSMQC